jgi:hypothetical protein
MVIVEQMKAKDQWLLLGREGRGSRSFLGCMRESIFGLANITISQSLLLMNEYIQ